MSAERAGKLLLVEDEHLLRGLIAQFLRGEGFEVVEAADGSQGVSLFASMRPFAVVLLDLNLPLLPGVEVCRRIRNEAACSAGHHLQRRHPGFAHHEAARDEGRTIPEQAVSSSGSPGPNRRCDEACSRAESAGLVSQPRASIRRAVSRPFRNDPRSYPGQVADLGLG